MKKILMALCLLAALSCGRKEETMKQLSDRVFALAKTQAVLLDSQLTDTTTPRTLTGPDGELVTAPITWWCSGFFPGTLWQIYEYTGDKEAEALARKNTLKLSSLLDQHTDHDIGFQLMCSYGNAYRLTGEKDWMPTLLAGAERLAGRFNPVTGVTRSWDPSPWSARWMYPVIIDNMMNLELLTTAAGFPGGNPEWVKIAETHAQTTMKNHFREDYSTWHVLDYDPETGAVRGKQTGQGKSDDSMWARGEAWALYGYAMMALQTKNPIYREQAEHIADLLIERLPEDGVPYWDFDAPGDYRDASAGAIMAGGFLKLYSMDKRDAYLQMAVKQLRALAGPEYLAEPGTNGGFLVKHCVGNIPGKSEIDVPLSYADYYLLEALNIYRGIAGSKK